MARLSKLITGLTFVLPTARIVDTPAAPAGSRANESVPEACQPSGSVPDAGQTFICNVDPVSCPRMVCSTSDDHDKAGTRAEAMMVSEAPERRMTSAVTAPDVSSWARKWYALSVSAQAVTSAASNGAPVANTPTPVLNDTVPS